MSGLFVQKHVEALRAQGCDVRVIFSQGLGDSWHQWRALRREGWMPDVVQLNVIQKQGLLAMWLKRWYGIPYLIIEHWSGYLPENGQFMRMSGFKRRLYRHIAREASMLLTVSNRHAEAMRDCGIEAKQWGRICNVVDGFFFESTEHRAQTVLRTDRTQRTDTRKTLLHVSCFDERAKNVKGLLRAAKMLSERRQDWKLVLVGTGVDYTDVRAFADTLEIPEGLLEWTGELTPLQVAEAFDNAAVFVLPSHYENAPVVISESLVKGVPIVSSQVGGIPEMVDEKCGILTEPGNDEQLVEALDTMLDHYQEYNKEVIRESGYQYSFAKVGGQLLHIYEQVLASK